MPCDDDAIRRRSDGGRMRVAGLLLATCLLVSPAAASELYGFDIPKRYPKAFATYSGVIPAPYRKIGWVRKLDGTTGPVEQVTVGGVPSVLFWMCEPHNCGGNELAALLAKDGSRAVALLQSTAHTAGKPIVFGTPSSEERALLDRAMQK
jgi:hypothetical protein